MGVRRTYLQREPDGPMVNLRLLRVRSRCDVVPSARYGLRLRLVVVFSFFDIRSNSFIYF